MRQCSGGARDIRDIPPRPRSITTVQGMDVQSLDPSAAKVRFYPILAEEVSYRRPTAFLRFVSCGREPCFEFGGQAETGSAVPCLC